MAAATAAFRDSQWGFMGMMSSASALSRISCRTPLPSLPMTTAIFPSFVCRRSLARGHISRKADACAQLGGGLIPCVSADAAQAIARLSAPDLCTIFGNLLDNAVEAVAAVPERGLRDVTLRINRRDGFLLIRTENRFEGERDASLASTKPNAQAHGYGMKNLRDAVARLGGEMTAGAQERQFIVNILLPAGE